MLPSTVLQDIEQLPPAAQSQIIDFIEFLKTRYPASPSVAGFADSLIVVESEHRQAVDRKLGKQQGVQLLMANGG